MREVSVVTNTEGAFCLFKVNPNDLWVTRNHCKDFSGARILANKCFKSFYFVTQQGTKEQLSLSVGDWGWSKATWQENWLKGRHKAWHYFHMLTSVIHNLHPQEIYAPEIHYSMKPQGLRYSISHVVKEEPMLSMANVPSLTGSPLGLGSEHRQQHLPFISASVISTQHAAITIIQTTFLDLHKQERQPATI